VVPATALECGISYAAFNPSGAAELPPPLTRSATGPCPAFRRRGSVSDRVGAAVIFTGITERKRAEEALRQANAALHSTNAKLPA